MYKISKKIRTVKAPLAISKFCSKGLKRPLLSQKAYSPIGRYSRILRGITRLSTAHPFGSAHLFGGGHRRIKSEKEHSTKPSCAQWCPPPGQVSSSAPLITMDVKSGSHTRAGSSWAVEANSPPFWDATTLSTTPSWPSEARPPTARAEERRPDIAGGEGTRADSPSRPEIAFSPGLFVSAATVPPSRPLFCRSSADRCGTAEFFPFH